MVAKQDNIKWLDGLRGFASFLVVVTHISRAFDPMLFRPATENDQPARLLQWPFIRVFFQGRIGVAIFALVTGYVCALKPIRQSRSSNYEGAFASIAKSSFRRVFRLVFPTTIATCIIWFFTQFGVFSIAKHSNSQWLSYTAPGMTPDFGEAVYTLIFNISQTWVHRSNAYDPNQWTLLPLLKGSMVVYTTCFATMYIRPRYRMMVCWAGWVYYYIAADAAFGMQMMFGMFMADLQNTPTAENWIKTHPRLRTSFAAILLILGMFLASYPEEGHTFCKWSNTLHDLGAYVIPPNHDFPRFFTAFGLELIVLGIHLSGGIRDVLSNRLFLWLGKNSFAVYLIHGSLLRSVLCWMMYGGSVPPDVQNDEGQWVHGPPLELKSTVREIFCVPIWFVMLYGVAHLWTTYVDPMCARWTAAIERYAVGQEENKEASSVLPH
ncbi:MAG: hypothetical protein M1818_003100 [Claussenomyces sp. TS43310]|nr:MAG: hypothetical protein M1818_003100 [Claussenomyces sp. TS43310]